MWKYYDADGFKNGHGLTSASSACPVGTQVASQWMQD